MIFFFIPLGYGYIHGIVIRVRVDQYFIWIDANADGFPIDNNVKRMFPGGELILFNVQWIGLRTTGTIPTGCAKYPDIDIVVHLLRGHIRTGVIGI
jgi:hypothetical protein